jgi:hypothetical protein
MFGCSAIAAQSPLVFPIQGPNRRAWSKALYLPIAKPERRGPFALMRRGIMDKA